MNWQNLNRPWDILRPYVHALFVTPLKVIVYVTVGIVCLGIAYCIAYSVMAFLWFMVDTFMAII